MLLITAIKKLDEIGLFKALIVTPSDMKDVSLLQYLTSEGKDYRRTSTIMSKQIPKLKTSKGQTISLTLFETPVVNFDYVLVFLNSASN